MRGAKVKMKLSRLIFLIPAFFILTSCNSGSEIKNTLTEELKAVTHANYVVKTIVSFPEKEAEFTLSYSHSPEIDRASVITPAEIAGVSYSISGDDSTIEFDGAKLFTGKLPDNSLSPLSAVHMLLEIWKSGNFEETTLTTMYGKPAVLAISRRSGNVQELEVRTWFSKDDFLPLYAEIFSGGERIIKCEFERSEHN